MRVIVCGGRNQKDKSYVFAELDKINNIEKITEIANGDADGVDKLSSEYADSRNIPKKKFPADWDKYGGMVKCNPAGNIRNREMLIQFKPDAVIVFRRESGPGTADMAKLAYKNNVRVIEVGLEQGSLF